MFERRITVDDVRYALSAGDTIEIYDNDKPYPSRLVLGWCGVRPLHIVAADNSDDDETIIITVYEPDPELWESDFTRRKS